LTDAELATSGAGLRIGLASALSGFRGVRWLALSSEIDRQRSAWWHDMRERQTAIGEHGLN
jgi:hypothetical protein